MLSPSMTSTTGRLEVDIHLKLGTDGRVDDEDVAFGRAPDEEVSSPGPAACASSKAFLRRVPADCFLRRRLIVSV